MNKKRNKNNAGRKSIVTPEVVAKLEKAFANAFTDEQASVYAGISRDCLYDYIKRNPKFSHRKEELKRRVDIAAKTKLVEAVHNGEMQSVRFWLERKCKDEFSTRTEATGVDGKELVPVVNLILNK